jgi:hypothetical protein
MAEQIQTLGNNPLFHKGQTLLTSLVANIVTEKNKEINKIILFIYSPR